MAISSYIEDKSNKNTVRITDDGQLVVAPISYSFPYYISVATPATAFEVVGGKTGKRFVITGLLIASDKTFASSTTSETVTIYEATPNDLDTLLETIFKVDLLRNDRLVATGLNLVTNKAKSLVASTPTSAAVDITLAGYYIPI